MDFPPLTDEEFLRWFAGFVDGDGCISLAFVVNQPKKGQRLELNVISQFTVTQTTYHSAPLYRAQKLFGVGHVNRYMPKVNYRIKRVLEMSHYVVRDRADLRKVLQVLAPLLVIKQYPAITMLRFLDMADAITARSKKGKRLDRSREELLEFAAMAMTMNEREDGESLHIKRTFAEEVRKIDKYLNQPETKGKKVVALTCDFCKSSVEVSRKEVKYDGYDFFCSQACREGWVSKNTPKI